MEEFWGEKMVGWKKKKGEYSLGKFGKGGNNRIENTERGNRSARRSRKGEEGRRKRGLIWEKDTEKR